MAEIIWNSRQYVVVVVTAGADGICPFSREHCTKDGELKLRMNSHGCDRKTKINTGRGSSAMRNTSTSLGHLLNSSNAWKTIKCETWVRLPLALSLLCTRVTSGNLLLQAWARVQRQRDWAGWRLHKHTRRGQNVPYSTALEELSGKQ